MTSVLDTLAYHPALKEDGYDSSQGVEGHWRLVWRLPGCRRRPKRLAGSAFLGVYAEADE